MHAEDQLREYVAKIWSKETIKSDYLCIASDCIDWIIYTPVLKKEALNSNSIKPSDIDLIKNEPFRAQSNSPESFYFWLDRVFFRENSITPTGLTICSEFGVNSPHFTKIVEGLKEVFERAKGMKEVQVAYNNWKKYLKYTYGDIDASETLFITHSYLSGLTKILMAQVIASKRKSSYEISDLEDILTGKYFYKLNIRNYVEKDFFYWINFKQFSPILNKQWETTFHLLRTYNFSKIDNDFLKDIYQGLVDPEDRHDLGEHYTPDWLCERMVIESLKKHDTIIPTIADITCGSGSFLRIAIHLLRDKFLHQSNLTKEQRNAFTKTILKNVIGFEIHPLACFIAKTNYMLALEDLLIEMDEPVYIPIFLCDSLLNSGLDQQDLMEKGKFCIYLDDKEYLLPRVEALTDERFDNIVDHIDAITHSYNSKEELNDDLIEKLLIQRINPSLVDGSDEFDLLITSFIKLTKALHEKVLNHENTIWSFVIKNNFRPIAFSNYMDIVVGNPPWLTFKDVGSGLYRQELESLGLKRYKIAPRSGKLRTHMELATIFLAHGVEAYLKKQGLIYFVLPRSLFSADHHTNFREQNYNIRMNIEAAWDMFSVEPLFRIPSCVIIASQNIKTVKENFAGKSFAGKLPQQNMNFSKASKFLKENDQEYHLVRMNDRTSFSNLKGNFKSKDNYYQKQFRQGATILPRNFYFVDTVKDFTAKKIVTIKTSESARKNSKKPYREVNLTGRANTKFLFHTLLAENILPYSATSPFVIHLPIQKIKDEWTYLSNKQMLAKGNSDSAQWFHDVEISYQKLSANKMSYFERINYHKGLFSQNPEKKFWVLYCAAGKNVCATVYKNNHLLWVEHKNYWMCPTTKQEAFYLVAILNSETVNEIIKPFQTKGLLGERDIEKKILDVGIPKFDKQKTDAAKLSLLAEKLTKKVEKSLSQYDSKSVGSRRNQVRAKFKTEFEEIDGLVKKLFKIK